MLFNKSRKRYKRIKAGIITSLLCTACLCFSVFAGSIPSDKTNVWLTVVETSTQARVSVTVPLAYGFVVVGSVDSEAVGAVSIDEGNLLLPNILVKVASPSDALPNEPGEANYQIQTFAEPSLPIKNYSTDVRDEDWAEDSEEEPLVREGLPVQLQPYMVELPNPNNPKNYWKPSSIEPTDAEADFKKFQFALDGMPFSIEGQKMLKFHGADSTPELTDVIVMDGLIDLDAPPDVPTYGYTAAGTANIPSVKYPAVDIKVGGKQNQYKQIEESLKVGEIHWEIIPGELPPLEP